MQIDTVGHIRSDGSLDLHLLTGLPESQVKVSIVISEPEPNQELKASFNDIEQQQNLTKLPNLDMLLSELP